MSAGAGARARARAGGRRRHRRRAGRGAPDECGLAVRALGERPASRDGAERAEPNRSHQPTDASRAAHDRPLHAATGAAPRPTDLDRRPLRACHGHHAQARLRRLLGCRERVDERPCSDGARSDETPERGVREGLLRVCSVREVEQEALDAVAPVHDAPDFTSAAFWSVAELALLVDTPANAARAPRPHPLPCPRR